MSASDAKTWLVAYDIREPRRLRRLHRCLKREGASVQYSAFSLEAGDAHLEGVLRRVEGLIDRRVDDVRAYHVPAHCRVWAIGRQQLPEGVYLEGSQAVKQLLEAAAQGDELAAASEAENADLSEP